MPAHIETCSHRGENSGDTEFLSGYVRDVTGHERDHDLDGRIVQLFADPGDGPSHDESHDDAPDRTGNETQARLPQNKRATRDDAHRDAVSNERGGIVDEALTLEQGDESAWHPLSLIHI